MKNQETFNVVMLPTEKASLLGLTNGKLYYSEFGQMTDNWGGQHLYILSNERIKEGDWVLHNSGYVSQVLGFNMDAIKLLDAQRWTKDCKKIIASTDKEITPETWIHDSFVNVFLLSYNNNKQITEIKLDIVPYDGTTPISEHWNGQIKTRKDGSVIIHQNKTYSQAEVDDLLDRFLLNIVDEAWMECTESTEVPSTDWAARMIAKANIDNIKLICQEDTHVDIDVKTEVVEKTCEWKSVDNGIMGFHDYEYMTTCKKTYDCDKIKVEKYCPNCGGKIK